MRSETYQVQLQAIEKLLTIEYQWINPQLKGRPLIVFLHEGLGSIRMWKEWPDSICDAVNARGLVFSRYGYGHSTPRPHDELWAVDYLNQQSADFLPKFFTALGLDQQESLNLIGHSDGGSIALLYSALQAENVNSAIVIAPHIFVEEVTIAGIRAARETYLKTNLSEKLARYHNDPESAFWAWNNAWLQDGFKDWNIEQEITGIRAPLLAMQGVNDEYATLAQIHDIAKAVPHTEISEIAGAGHTPFKDQAELVQRVIVDFLQKHLPN